MQLRLLDIHGSSRQETVIDTRKFLLEAVPESAGMRKFKFYPVYYDHGILSCVYTSKRKGETTNFLILINTDPLELIDVQEMDSVHRLFVRNTKKYVYVGTHSMRDDDGYRRWVLDQFDVDRRQWSGHRLFLADMVGSEVGQDVCFEILGDYFYGISNESEFGDSESKTASYYYAFRFPVGLAKRQHIEVAGSDCEYMWRRNHLDGVIDNRWTVLRLEKDEETGKVMVLECLKEFLARESKSLRTCYRRELEFVPPADIQNPELSLSNEHDPGKHPLARSMGQEMSGDELVCSKTWHPPQRYIHHGDEGASSPVYTLSQCFVRDYMTSSSAFIDLVNDPSPSRPLERRLRLRVRPKGKNTADSKSRDGGQRQPIESVEKVTEGQGKDQYASQPDIADSLMKLESIMNPASHSGEIRWVLDSRSLIYSLANEDGMNALVFIGFDPSIRIHGLPSDRGGCQHEKVSGLFNELNLLEESAESRLKLDKTKRACPLAADWARFEKPLYSTIQREGSTTGIDFCR